MTGTTVLPLSGPVDGETEVIVGCCSTVKLIVSLLTLPTTTVTGPLVALLGT